MMLRLPSTARLLRNRACLLLRRPLSTTTANTTTARQPAFESLLTRGEEALMDEQQCLSRKAMALARTIGPGVEIRDTRFLYDILPEESKSYFSIVVAGEFNAGKSSIINALLGAPTLDTGALPTTDVITVLTHKAHATNAATASNGIVCHSLPSIPPGVVVVDTPGTNAVLVDHTAMTLKLLPTADLILFCTSADRPFSESEQQLLQSIQQYRKRITILINKMDVLSTSGGNHGAEEKQRVENFVKDHVGELLGGRPVVISISAKDALASKLSGGGSNSLWERSNFWQLETYLKESLTEETKIKAKLLNPLGVAEGMLKQGLELLRSSATELETDVATLKLVTQQFEAWKKEMLLDITTFCAEMQTDVSNESQNMDAFIKKVGTLQLLQWALLDNDRLTREWNDAFTTSVNTGAPNNLQKHILQQATEIADDVIITKSSQQGQAVISYLGKRPSVQSQHMIGSPQAATNFSTEVRNTLVTQLENIVMNIIKDNHSEKSRENMLVALKQSAILALSLETFAAAILLASYIDIALSFDQMYTAPMGLLLAASGIGVAVRSPSIAAKKNTDEWQQRGLELNAALKSSSLKQMDKINRRILDSIKPYSRYVETEQARIENLSQKSEELLSETNSLRSRVNKLRHY